jgi:AraC-like DNA-binding protein
MIPEIPIHIDFFALFMFLGLVQGVFLSYFFLNKQNRKLKSNLYLGLLLLASTILNGDIFISYTNIMMKVLFLVDFSEPLNFIIAPLFFFYITAKIDVTKIKKPIIHFIPTIFYSFYALFFQVQSINYKFNSYLHQYHPDMDYINAPAIIPEDPLHIKRNISIFIIASFVFYLSLSIKAIYNASKTTSEKESRKKLFRILWFDVTMVIVILALFIISKNYFVNDLGDYIIMIAVTIMMYIITFIILKDSIFFQTKLFETKYSKSGLDDDMAKKILDKILHLMESEKYFFTSTPSVGELAKKIATSPNYVSQVINQELNLTFNELLAKYRINEAKRILSDPNTKDTIEQIAYIVGYNSKSTFHTTFKKITGKTPSEYKASKNT